MTSEALQRVLEGCETLARHFPGTSVVKRAQSGEWNEVADAMIKDAAKCPKKCPKN